jgi:hypothetical protein
MHIFSQKAEIPEVLKPDILKPSLFAMPKIIVVRYYNCFKIIWRIC